MDKRQIKKAAMEYAERIPLFDDRKRYCREDFIAGAEFIADYLCKLPLNLAVKQLHDYCKEKLGTEKEKKL